MKQRLGALLCLALGAVLITTGLAPGGAAIGSVAVACQVPVGITTPCPTGTITVNETTVPTSATPPAGGWIVHVTSSNCLDPTANPVDVTLTIADGGSATTSALFVYTDFNHGTKCSYILTEEPADVFSPEFNPASPVTLPFNQNQQTGNDIAVQLTNTFVPPTSTTPTPTPTPTPTTTVVTDPVVLTPTSSSAPVIAVTGPHEQVRATIWIGVGLCLLGLVLLLGGRGRTRRAQHRP
ncbi:MAG TPA: hypothetical protein VHS54_03435 [Jatrophihabitans sp.]|jgi:hypothetical protein|nr:hypothetical protein [Jatrophihabitans sp.]